MQNTMAQMSVSAAFVSFRKEISSGGGQKSTIFQTPTLKKGNTLRDLTDPLGKVD